MQPIFEIGAVCNWLVIGITCLVSWRGFRSRALEERFVFEPEAILARKEYYRLVTSGFLHADTWHLLVNMFSLYMFGRSVEFALGAGDFLLIYFGSVVGGSLLSLYVHRHHAYRAYGASGGVCGIIFAYILLFPGARIYQFPVPFPIPAWLYAIGFLVLSFFGMAKNNKGNIGHDAHLGGAIIGMLVAAAFHPEMALTNWKIFLIVLIAAVLLWVCLWINPLFLPIDAFFGRATKTRRRSPPTTSHGSELLKVDALLEKISQGGMESLSAEERKFLATVSEKSRSRGESKKPESGLAI